MNHADKAQLFSMLANETRIRLLEILKNKELSCHNLNICDVSDRCCNITELSEELGIAMSTTSYNIKELRRCGIISIQRRGRKIYCSINERVVKQIIDFFESLAPQPKPIKY